MKKLALLLLVVGVLLGLGACFEQTTSRPSSATQETASREVGTAEVGPAPEWPPGLGEVEVDLEQDMLKKNYYVIFDGSGSMGGQRIEVAKRAIKEFVAHVPLDSNLGLFVFDRAGVSERSPLGSSRKVVMEEIDKVEASRGTPLTEAVRYGFEMLSLQGLKQLGYGEYNLVVVTDGEADSGSDLRRTVDEVLNGSPVIIRTIGYQIKGGHTLNQPDRIFYRSAENFEQLSQGLQEVLAEAEDFRVDDFQASE